jgi:hypothetical protein
VMLRWSSMGQLSTWAAIAGAPRSRAISVTPRCESPACADTGDDDACGVDAEVLGVLGGPEQTLVAVLDQGRAGDLRRQPVVHGDHGGAEPLEPLQRDP